MNISSNYGKAGDGVPEPARAVLAELRTATAAAHRRLERRHPLTAADLSPQRYTAVLRAYYGFYRPVEQALEPLTRDWPELDWEQRRKTPLLEADLDRLAPDRAGSLPLCRCHWLAPEAGLAGALGTLYVLEGATLGGRILARLAHERLGLGSDTGAAFLTGYGPSTDRMWRRFLGSLGVLQGAAAREQAVEAAEATFASFEHWLEARDVLKPLHLTTDEGDV